MILNPSLAKKDFHRKVKLGVFTLMAIFCCCKSTAAQDMEKSWRKQFPTTTEQVQLFKIKAPSFAYKQILIGNKNVGFYSISEKNQIRKDNDIYLRLFPLTYKKPVDIHFTDQKDQHHWVQKITFKKSQFIQSLPQVEIKKKFLTSFFYFSVGLTVAPFAERKHYNIFLMNNLGEILGAFSPPFLNPRILLADLSADGHDLMLVSGKGFPKKPFALRVDFLSGREEIVYWPWSEADPHHQIRWDSSNTIKFLSRNELQIFPEINILGLYSKRISLRRDSLIEFDLTTKKIKKIWSTPLNWKLLQISLHNVGAKADSIEWAHLNSFDNYQQEWILSNRDQNEIQFSSSKKIISGNCRLFCAQHSVIFDETEQVITLLNNNLEKGNAEILKLNMNGELLWKWQSPWWTPRRGSVTSTPHKTYVALLPKKEGEFSSIFTAAHLIEIEQNGTTPLATAHLPFEGMSQIQTSENFAGYLKVQNPFKGH